MFSSVRVAVVVLLGCGDRGTVGSPVGIARVVEICCREDVAEVVAEVKYGHQRGALFGVD